MYLFQFETEKFFITNGVTEDILASGKYELKNNGKLSFDFETVSDKAGFNISKDSYTTKCNLKNENTKSFEIILGEQKYLMEKCEAETQMAEDDKDYIDEVMVAIDSTLKNCKEDAVAAQMDLWIKRGDEPSAEGNIIFVNTKRNHQIKVEVKKRGYFEGVWESVQTDIDNTKGIEWQQMEEFLNEIKKMKFQKGCQTIHIEKIMPVENFTSQEEIVFYKYELGKLKEIEDIPENTWVSLLSGYGEDDEMQLKCAVFFE